MKLIIETDQELTPIEVSILQTLLAAHDWPPAKPAEAPSEPAKKPRAPKAPKEPAKPAETPSEPAETPSEPAELDEKVLGRVIDEATDLINQGKASRVKKALAEVGVPKVGAIETTEQAEQMLALLS